MTENDAPTLDMQLRRRPIRELRAALTRLGRSTTGCVERGDFVSSLLEASSSELAAALGGPAEQGAHEKADLLLQLLDASTKTEGTAADSTKEQLPPGSFVRLFNLQSAPALNMQRALVVRYDSASDRYEVRLDWDGSVKKVRYDNLQMEENASPAATTPATAAPPAAATEPPEPSENGEAAAAAQAVASAEAMPCAAAEAGSPERKSRHEEVPSVTAGASPALSLAESFVDAMSEECGLGAQDDAVMEASPPLEPFPSSSAEAVCSSIGDTITLPTTMDVEGASADPHAVAQEDACRSEEESKASVEEAACRTAETEHEVSAPGGEAASSPAAIFISLPMAPDRCQEIGTPSTDSSSLTAGLPRKATKLRVGYHGHRDAAEESGLLVEGLRQLWRAGELCDVTLACRESTFRVHRLVLASQSSELREFLADRSEVQMPDVSYPESLQLCIEFLYEAEGEKGYAPSCGEINMEVLELAHKFQLPGLKRRAASFMAQALTTLNILRCLSACETFALHDLKEKIISHVAANKKVLAEIIDGPHIAQHPELLRQILLRVASAKDPNAPSKRARLSQ